MTIKIVFLIHLEVTLLLAIERMRIITELVSQNMSVKVVDLVAQFGVSNETIRRDLELLERQGIVRRVYGGAVKAQSESVQSYQERISHRITEKEAIGKLAADIVQDGDTIIIDVGTTALEFAKNLLTKNNLTVITPSLSAALLLLNNSNARVIVTGGELEREEPYLTGPIAKDAFRRYHAHRAFISVGGISKERGLTDYNELEVETRKVMLKSASQIIGLVDSSKMGVVATSIISDIDTLDILVTDNGISNEMKEFIEGFGVNLGIG